MGQPPEIESSFVLKSNDATPVSNKVKNLFQQRKSRQQIEDNFVKEDSPSNNGRDFMDINQFMNESLEEEIESSKIGVNKIGN